jgi:type I restriction enzyme, S subunit
MTLTLFSDVVHLSKDRIKDPLAAGIERFVGLEHITPEDLRIRSWGAVADGTTFTSYFKPGQVLFGKRRAYQRKVAVADFSGVCSGDIYIFESKDPDVLLPELLPFICQSEGFYNYAVSTSAGSLSPRTNWKQLAKYEFPLPPLDEQRRIAKLLSSAENVLQSIEYSIIKTAALRRSALSEWTNHGISHSNFKTTAFGKIPEEWEVISIGKILDACEYGLSVQVHAEGEYPIFRMMNIEDGRMVANDMKYVQLPKDEFKKYRVLPGDILFNRTNSDDLVGKLGIFDLPGDYVFASYLIRLQANRSKVLPEYLNFFMNSPEGQQRIRSYATKGVSQTNINASNLKKVLVPLPPLDEQEEIVRNLSQIYSAKSKHILRKEKQKELNKNMLSALLAR